MSGPDRIERVYDGKLLEVVVEHWGESEREIVKHPGSVAIVPVDGESRVTLVRQLREPARKLLLELPAGTLEPGEDPLDSAKRELAEETGLRGGEWRHVGGFWTSPGFLEERMDLFVATGLVPGETDTDENEEIELVRWPVDEIPDRLHEIEDVKTLAGLLFYLRTR